MADFMSEPRKIKDFSNVQEEELAVKEEAKDEYTEILPGFSLVNVEDDVTLSATKCNPQMEAPTYIGDSEMLMRYLVKTECDRGVTIPITACGVDRVALDALLNGEQFIRTEQADLTGEDVSIYELINVDGDTYLSCVSRCLNPAYLNTVLEEATAAILANGVFAFELVGYRMLECEEGESSKMFRTMRLNSFELSVLIDYMNRYEGMRVSYRYDSANRKSVVFVVKNEVN